MIPNIDPKKMQAMLRQMGIEMEELEGVKRVIFEKENGEKLVIDKPEVVKTTAKGRSSYQISGNEFSISNDDIEMVVSQVGISKSEALELLISSHGDIAEAIMEAEKRLKKE